jgi:malate dehydrogenase (oxaloacetate-decarboxylating)
MFEFKIIRGSDGKISHIETSLSGNQLLASSKLNKGCAFTHEERELFHLEGLLPTQIETLDSQAARMYLQFNQHSNNLSKNIYLNVLHDYNETLFYRLTSQHLEEMLPIVYTPTVGEAVQNFSLEHRKPRGLYIGFNDRNRIDEILENRLPPEVDLSVVTDGEAVLGIGDQGIGGINISNAKLMVYTLCAGINPHRFLPIQLDVGTNNLHLLNDPMYLGWRHERITGQAYDDFIDAFVQSMTKKFPHLFLHWEDFGRDNARRILDRYRKKICTFNGDMQATGVVALACVLAGVHASGMPLREHRIVIMGAGTAGVGIADQIYSALRREGLSEQEAYAKFWLLDKSGLLTTHSSLLPFQKPFARDAAEIEHWQRSADYIDLYDVVLNTKPTILIGCSTVTGAFNEKIIRLMAENVERPIIMPLSNPNSLSEARPDDLLKWTDARAIIATGSPFPDVEYENKCYRIAQSNNAFAFPGVGLGAIAVKAKHISDDMLWAATKALTACSPSAQDKTAPILPRLSDSKIVSVQIALAVAAKAREEGLAQIPEDADLHDAIKRMMWEPEYYPYRRVSR